MTNNRSTINVSKTIRNGTVVMTRDEYFEDHNNYKKPNHINDNSLYRETTVVDSNSNNELALVKQQSSGQYSVINKNKQIRKYAPYIKTKDDEGNPIRLGSKFIRGNPKYDVTKTQAKKMKSNCINNKNAKISNENRQKIKELKNKKTGH